MDLRQNIAFRIERARTRNERSILLIRSRNQGEAPRTICGPHSRNIAKGQVLRRSDGEGGPEAHARALRALRRAVMDRAARAARALPHRASPFSHRAGSPLQSASRVCRTVILGPMPAGGFVWQNRQPPQAAASAMRAKVSSRPRTAITSKMPGDAVEPTSAARSGCATAPSFSSCASA